MLTLAKEDKNRTVRILPWWMSDSHRELAISDAASPVFFFFFFHEKPHEGKGGPRKKFVTKSQGLGLTWDKTRSWKELKLTRGRWCECVCKRHRERARKRGSVRWVKWRVSISSVGNPSRKPQPSPPTWAEELWAGPFTDPTNSPSQTRSRVDAGKGDQRKESWWKGIPYVSKNQALGIGKDAISERQRETGKTS